MPLLVRLSCSALLLALVGCSSSTIAVYLNSSESVAPLRQGLEGPETLIRAKQVRLTVATAAIHLAPSLSSGVGDPSEASGWTEVIETPQVVDLMNLRADQVKLLGEGVLPVATRLTQVRLRLRSDELGPAGWMRVKDAVIDAADRTCDLLIPESAVVPGLSVEGGMNLVGDEGHLDVYLSIRLDDSVEIANDPVACTWSLNPVLYLRPSAPPTETP